MTNLIGEYECHLDPKGRLMFPAELKRQLEPSGQNRFVINRSVFQPCLVIYPMDEWEKVTQQLDQLNSFNRKNDMFIRKFRNGATLIEMDKAGRILIPKRLKQFAGLERKLVLFANSNIIEVWDHDRYEELINSEWEDFGELAEEVMGEKNDPEKDNEE